MRASISIAALLLLILLGCSFTAERRIGEAMGEGRWQDAIPLLEEEIRIHPDDGILHRDLGRALLRLGRYDEALQQDDYVIGYAVFTAGAMGDRWKTYDITPILRHIATFLIIPNTW